MVHLPVAELLKARGETAYMLSKGTGLTLTRAYRLARADGRFERIEAEALDALCAYFGVQPGELLEHVAEPGSGRGAASSRRAKAPRRRSGG
jgi:DNA-binding Xre family transcriptional regulator